MDLLLGISMPMQKLDLEIYKIVKKYLVKKAVTFELITIKNDNL